MNNSKLPKINNEISNKNPQLQVRLLSDTGDMLGVMNVREAIKIAHSKGLDLIEVSPNADPVVCKIGDFGKIKYDMQKKLSEERKRNKIHEIKEVKFSVNIAIHDYNVKLSHIKSFIESGFSVKVSCLIKGRDRSYGKDRLAPLFDKIILDVGEIATISGKVVVRDNGGDFMLIPKK